jgi:hypothetical protein
MQAARQTGKWYAELDTPDIPFEMWNEWEWFMDLNSRRSAGFSGPDPLSYQEMIAWMRYTGVRPSPLQRRMLVDLDRTFLAVYGEVNDG